MGVAYHPREWRRKSTSSGMESGNPRPPPASRSTDLGDRLLNLKPLAMDEGELTAHTFAKWAKTCQMVVRQFGGNHLVETPGPDDFDTLYSCEDIGTRDIVQGYGDRFCPRALSVCLQATISGSSPAPSCSERSFDHPTKRAAILPRQERYGRSPPIRCVPTRFRGK